jgi:hypothetical protein
MRDSALANADAAAARKDQIRKLWNKMRGGTARGGGY